MYTEQIAQTVTATVLHDALLYVNMFLSTQNKPTWNCIQGLAVCIQDHYRILKTEFCKCAFWPCLYLFFMFVPDEKCWLISDSFLHKEV